MREKTKLTVERGRLSYARLDHSMHIMLRGAVLYAAFCYKKQYRLRNRI